MRNGVSSRWGRRAPGLVAMGLTVALVAGCSGEGKSEESAKSASQATHETASSSALVASASTAEAERPALLRAGEACYVGGRVHDKGRSLTLEADGEADGLGSDTIEDVSCVLDAISAPDYVRQNINSTRALDGQQEDSWAGVRARWTYHPDTGLQITLVEDGMWPPDVKIPALPI